MEVKVKVNLDSKSQGAVQGIAAREATIVYPVPELKNGDWKALCDDIGTKFGYDVLATYAIDGIRNSLRSFVASLLKAGDDTETVHAKVENWMPRLAQRQRTNGMSPAQRLLREIGKLTIEEREALTLRLAADLSRETKARTRLRDGDPQLADDGE